MNNQDRRTAPALRISVAQRLLLVFLSVAAICYVTSWFFGAALFGIIAVLCECVFWVGQLVMLNCDKR